MSATDLQLRIISAEKTLYSGKVNSVTLPGTLGKFTILPDHAPLISSLNAGTISYLAKSEIRTIEVRGGFAEVNQNVVTVCVE